MTKQQKINLLELKLGCINRFVNITIATLREEHATYAYNAEMFNDTYSQARKLQVEEELKVLTAIWRIINDKDNL